MSRGAEVQEGAEGKAGLKAAGAPQQLPTRAGLGGGWEGGGQQE